MIIVLAVVLRAGATAVIADGLPSGTDEQGYQAVAISVSEGHGYPARPAVFGGGPSAIQVAGYPFVVGALYAVTGSTAKELAYGLDALLGGATVALLGVLAWQVWGRRRVALAAMCIGAVYPPLVVLGAPLLTESLFAPLLLGALAATIELRRTRRLRWAVAAGLLLGCSIMTKTSGEILTLAVAASVWQAPRLRWASIRAPVVVLALALAVAAPWTIRNAAKFHAFVPISTEVGYGFAGAFNQTTYDDPSHQWRSPYQLAADRRLIFRSGLDEAAASRRLESRVADFALDHPLYPLSLGFQNLVRMLELRAGGGSEVDAQLNGFGNAAAGMGLFQFLFRLDQIAFLALLALAIAAVVQGRLGRLARVLGIPVLVGLALMAAVFLEVSAAARFRLPVDLLLIVLVAPLVAGPWGRDSRPSPRLN